MFTVAVCLGLLFVYLLLFIYCCYLFTVAICLLLPFVYLLLFDWLPFVYCCRLFTVAVSLLLPFIYLLLFVDCCHLFTVAICLLLSFAYYCQLCTVVMFAVGICLLHHENEVILLDFGTIDGIRGEELDKTLFYFLVVLLMKA